MKNQIRMEEKNWLWVAAMGALWLFVLFGWSHADGAQPVYTAQPARVLSFTAQVVYDAGGNVTAVPVQVVLLKPLVNNALSTDVRGNNETFVVNFDALASSLSATTITAAGKTVTYPQWASICRQASLDQAATQGITKIDAKNPGNIAVTP